MLAERQKDREKQKEEFMKMKKQFGLKAASKSEVVVEVKAPQLAAKKGSLSMDPQQDSTQTGVERNKGGEAFTVDFTSQPAAKKQAAKQ